MTPKKGEKPRQVKKRYGGGEIHLYAASQMRRIRKRSKPVPVALPLTPENVACACWTANKTAKRYRDAASRQYGQSLHGFARRSREIKERMYQLKDLAVAWLAHHGHVAAEGIHGGLCLWTGLGYSFHSTLVSNGVELPADPEPITISASEKCTAEMRLIDAEDLLERLPDHTSEFARLEVPRIARPAREVVCYGCGQVGHIRRDCPNECGEFDECDHFGMRCEFDEEKTSQ
ncbi:MAG TPA: hypothetical protein VMP01_28620 [Pirellulaceae bacterium]|nr:hypothetical protein [Pirellulaceae bacterium]